MNDMLALMVLGLSLAGGYKLWRDALDARENANRIAKDACARAGVQFLDGTAAFASMKWQRGADGRRRWQRTYTFDYSADGQGRAQGFVVLVSGRLESLGLAGETH
jgi:hypothetical protein